MHDPFKAAEAMLSGFRITKGRINVVNVIYVILRGLRFSFSLRLQKSRLLLPLLLFFITSAARIRVLLML